MREFCEIKDASRRVSLSVTATMGSDSEEQREEFPRISVDSLRDWRRIKLSYTTAAYKELEGRIAGRSETDKNMLRGQLQRVCRSPP